METKDYDNKVKELKKALRKHVKAIKGKDEKILALELLDEFIELVNDASCLELADRKKLFKMIVLAWNHLQNGKNLLCCEDEVDDDDYDSAMDAQYQLCMEVYDGKL